MELHLGKMTNKELAEWFGVKPNSFAPHKTQKLKELKQYAEFYEEKGKVIITKIIEPLYVKKNEKLYQDIIEEMPKEWNEDAPYNTCSWLANKFCNTLPSTEPYKKSTVYNYTRAGKMELYGKTWGEPGKLGSSIYTFCKIEDGQCVPFNEEEQKIKRELQVKYFGDATEKQILIQAMVKAKKISNEEAWSFLEEWTGMGDEKHYFMFLDELEEKLGGVRVQKVTMIKPLVIEQKGVFEF